MPSIAAQAEELNGFIRKHLSSGDNIGSTIVFYAKKEAKNALLGLVPTESVKLVRVARYQPENILEALQTVENAEKTHLYLFPSGFAGSEIAVRWACRMKGSSLVQVKQIECSGAQLIARKTVYANHVLGTFKLTQKPYCISLDKGSADRQAITIRDKRIVTEHDLTGLQKDRFIKHSNWIPTETTQDLEAATFLIVGGRGMHSKENTQRLKKIADALGAAFGVSRPVAMSAWTPLHRMIGVSGAMTKPEVCIAAGVSGAAAFYAGIEKSKTIVAINTDIRAPIIKAADVAIIDDYKAVMAELAKIVLC
ncbi:MAG: electron transfer flavoprotein subunit alpha/FixB family protein [Desulfobacterales bacterium]